MGVLAGILSLAALSLFLAHVLRRSSALTPILAVAAAMVYFSLCGIFGVLQGGGFVWFIGCALALLYTIIKTKKRFWGLFSTGFVFFAAGSALFLLYCLATRPMLTHWDEFTFWGTAAKVTSNANELYTTARSSLIARSYQPGLIVFSYMMQFFGGFTEAGFIASFMVVYLACLCAPSALWQKNKTAAVLFLAGLFCLPLLFSPGIPAGQMQWTYLVCMADLPLALVCGGTICFYFAGEEKDTRLLVSFGILLAALTLMKDMGLAFAMIALAVAVLDMFFCERERLSFFALKKLWGLLVFALYCVVLVVGAYALWTWHFNAATKLDRLNFGSQGASLDPLTLLITGVQMLFGVNRSEQFSAVLSGMGRAFFTEPVSLLGSGTVILCVILLICVLAFVFSATRRQRKRVAVFTLGMALLFVAFYVFNIFTYALVFKHQEALVLKDYARYISPFWVAWMMGALTLLARTAVHHKASFYRLRLARAFSGAGALCIVLVVALLGSWQGNFLRVSPSQYSVRRNVRTVTNDAITQGMKAEDVVYIISQGDDGTRFYLFGYELPAVRTLLYNGFLLDIAGEVVTDEAGMPVLHGNAAATLAPYGLEYPPPYASAAVRKDLVAFLKKEGCTHVLLDVVDDYILEEFAPMFSDRLKGWSASDPHSKGHRYYRIEWDEKGGCTLVPALNADGNGGAAA